MTPEEIEVKRLFYQAALNSKPQSPGDKIFGLLIREYLNLLDEIEHLQKEKGECKHRMLFKFNKSYIGYEEEDILTDKDPTIFCMNCGFVKEKGDA